MSDTAIIAKDKRCSRCNKLLAETTENFEYNKKRNQFRAQCRKCKYVAAKERGKLETDAKLYREHVRIGFARHQAKKYNTVSDLTMEDWNFAKSFFDNRCAICGQDPKENGLYLALFALERHKDGGAAIPANTIPVCWGEGGCCQQSFVRSRLDFINLYPNPASILLQIAMYQQSCRQVDAPNYNKDRWIRFWPG